MSQIAASELVTYSIHLIRWMLIRSAKEDHPCLTGKCGHELGTECEKRLLADFMEDKIFE